MLVKKVRDLAMDCNAVKFTRHAFERIFERDIYPDAILRIIREGEVIESYPDDQPFPSVLILGFEGKMFLHVVVAIETTAGCVSS